MPIHTVASVDTQPHITLERWMVYETERGEHHFVGHSIETGSGRVSSAIVSYDNHARTGLTRSGRLYRLAGPPDVDGNTEYVWAFWSQRNGVLTAKDVTEAYLKHGTGDHQAN